MNVSIKEGLEMYRGYCNPNPCFPHNHGKFWSRAEDFDIRCRFASGQSITRIARAHGRTRESIRARILGG